jgi:hypothetical protein
MLQCGSNLPAILQLSGEMDPRIDEVRCQLYRSFEQRHPLIELVRTDQSSPQKDKNHSIGRRVTVRRHEHIQRLIGIADLERCRGAADDSLRPNVSADAVV